MSVYNTIFAVFLLSVPVKVGTAGSDPFVMKNNQGISVEVWDKIAQKKDIDYEIEHFNSVDDVLAAKASGAIDVVVGPITINSDRQKKYGEFSQPYFETKMGFLGERDDSVFGYAKHFFNKSFFFGLAIFVSLLFLVGSLIWACERKENKDFESGIRGVMEGAWFSLVTMTTVGYGDKVPRTFAGRALTVIWMMVGILMFSTLTAFLTNAFEATGEDISNIENKRIAVIEGSTGETFARNRGAKILSLGSLEEALVALNSKKVEGIVFDGPALQFVLKNQKDSSFEVHLYDKSSENYGFISNIDIDVEILEMKESGEIQNISGRWLSEI